MPLQKQPISINFSQGLDQKSDNKQVSIGKFIALENSVFDTVGRLTKRNGYPLLTTLPNALQTTLTTLNNNLLATGSNLYAYSADTTTWSNQGTVQPVSLAVTPLVRVSTSQSACDSATASNGLTCLAYTDNSVAYYQLSDSETGQQVKTRTALPSTATNPKVYVLDKYFIITFMATVSAAPHFQYIAINISNPTNITAATDISTNVSAITTGHDGKVANNSLYLAWTGTSTTVQLAFLTSTLIVAATASITSHTATKIAVVADLSTPTPIIWVVFWDGTNAFAAAYSSNLILALAATAVFTSLTISQITGTATGNVLTAFFQNTNTYPSQMNSDRSDYISSYTVTIAGTVVGPTVVLRSVGLASKAFIGTNNTTYMLAVYSSSNQPSYFLIDSSGNIYMRLAYSNGGGYISSVVLPSVSYQDTTYYSPYLIKDFLAPINKNTNLPSGTPITGIYTQTGINLAKFSINTAGQHSSEIANALHLTGGQLWEYDGVKPVEHSFHVYPDLFQGYSDTNTGAGNVSAQTYYYQFTYEWTDNQGNLHRSAPSVPIKQVVGTSGSTNTIYAPTLRLTYKTTPNKVRITGYRWSTAQQVYYQFTTVPTSVANDTTVDYVVIADANSDAQILGNPILYTTGGVLENIAAPASFASALYKNRLFIIDSEDRNLLWYSKQVLQNTPVEMSDLQTIYVAPTSGAQGSTGAMTAISAMDDKFIIFKKDAIYYVTGNGPDITGANNDFSDPIFITSSVGCSNPNSIVLMPSGLMFQSDKGIWLLGRDLQTTYIGAPVEQYALSSTVESAQVIPGTNQVRFILDTQKTLMYDYYVNQWGTFSNLNAISATLYNDLHTYLNPDGQIYQETAGTYLDGSRPVLISFTTSWMNLAGIQGYERFYQAFLLGAYYSPFTLNVQFAYDYNPSPIQSVIVTPDNITGVYGDEDLYGSGQYYGGTGNNFEARVFPQLQKCESFQLIITEQYDSSSSIAAGQGLNLSGINLLVGLKKGSRTQKASQSFG